MRNLKTLAFGLGILATAGIAMAQNGTYANGSGENVIRNQNELPNAILHDNGPFNGTNGYSNAVVEVFNARRTLLDDFVVTDDRGWRITDFHWLHVWGNSGGPKGTGVELQFRADNAGTPGDVIAVANITNYGEQGDGNSYFSRDGMNSWADFDPIDLGAGTYWWEATIVGPENNFWLTADQQGNECWVNYDDFGGLQPGSAIFGTPSDLNFILTGEIIPTPGSLALLGLGGLACGTRRRRR